MEKIWVLYSTFGNRDEAIFVAQTLLGERLIACANIYDQVTSLYRWQGEIQKETEVVMVAKTAEPAVPKAIAAIKRLHSYELPCVVSYPVENGFEPYLQWVNQETNRCL